MKKKETYLFCTALWLSHSFLAAATILFCGKSTIGIILGSLFMCVSSFSVVSVIMDINQTLNNEVDLLNRLDVRAQQVIKLRDKVFELEEGIKLYRQLYCHTRSSSNGIGEEEVLEWEKNYGVKNVEFPRGNTFFSWILELLKL